jgi:hypothetical protein
MLFLSGSGGMAGNSISAQQKEVRKQKTWNFYSVLGL